MLQDWFLEQHWAFEPGEFNYPQLLTSAVELLESTKGIYKTLINCWMILVLYILRID